MASPYLDLLEVDLSQAVGRVTLARPTKRNALSDRLVAALRDVFENLPATVRCVVLDGQGDHFCAGLDLAEMSDHDVLGGILHSRSWHAAFERIQFGRVPVVSVLKGAVVGGGLELACSTHLRVAEDSTFFALPEGTRGLFVGGGGSVRIPRVIGVARMADMMLTGRVLDAREGEQAGLAQYRVNAGEGLDRALALAERIAANAPLSNFAILQALPRIANQSMDDGFMMEALMAGIAQSDPAAKARMQDFLQNKANRVRRDA